MAWSLPRAFKKALAWFQRLLGLTKETQAEIEARCARLFKPGVRLLSIERVSAAGEEDLFRVRYIDQGGADQVRFVVEVRKARRGGRRGHWGLPRAAVRRQAQGDAPLAGGGGASSRAGGGPWLRRRLRSSPSRT